MNANKTNTRLLRHNALIKVTEYVNRRTQTSSPEACIQQVVRRAFIESVEAIYDLEAREGAEAWRKAAEVATGRDLYAEDIELAAQQQEDVN